NFLKTGMTTITEQEIREEIDLSGLLDRAVKLSKYDEKRKEFSAVNNGQKRGMGIAAFLHGAGFTGSGERYLNSMVGVEGLADGTVRVLVSSAEFGQGTNTVLCQVAAQELGIPYELVTIAQPDTTVVPNSGPTVASRTAMIVGKLVQSAARGLKQTLVGSGFLQGTYESEQFRKACKEFVAIRGALKSYSRYDAPPGICWDDSKYKGEAYSAFAWAVYIAEVAVDPVTYGVSVGDFVALQEIGKVLHPLLAEGQIAGGVAQAIGFALYEKVVWQRGRMANNQMTNYIMPTSVDLPPIRVFFEEKGNVHGAYGAKGIGELPMDGPAPAIVNAVEDAVKIRFDSIPLMPEDIFRATTVRQNA